MRKREQWRFFNETNMWKLLLLIAPLTTGKSMYLTDSCVCEGAQGRTGSRRFSWQGWNKGAVASHLLFYGPHANVTWQCLWNFLAGGWRASWSQRTPRGESEFTVIILFYNSIYIIFRIRTHADFIYVNFPQGGVGPPGQAGVDGLRGDQGVPVGVKSTYELMFETILLCLE